MQNMPENTGSKMKICEHCGQPIPLLAAQDLKAKKRRGKITFTQWRESHGDADAIPANHHALRYAQAIGLPQPFVELAWDWFESEYANSKKLYADWGTHFRKSLEQCWCKYWAMNRQTKEFFLTLQGQQAKIAREKGL
jgi:hypothetical protein